MCNSLLVNHSGESRMILSVVCALEGANRSQLESRSGKFLSMGGTHHFDEFLDPLALSQWSHQC